MNSLNNRSHCTAITRKNPSVPMRNLNKLGLLENGRKLDYGCGRGFDADFFHMDRFDPHYSPATPTKKYDTITCNYVLNVVNKDQGARILQKIEDLLKDGGTAYITVRRDIKKEGKTSKGTYQRNVFLDLPILKETSTYCTYFMKQQVVKVSYDDLHPDQKDQVIQQLLDFLWMDITKEVTCEDGESPETKLTLKYRGKR